MATPAQLEEKLRKEFERSSNIEAIATPAQLAEKSRQAQPEPSYQAYATEAQLAEKATREQPNPSSLDTFATENQLSEKSQRASPPPLPPRGRLLSAPAPPYTSDDARRSELISNQWRSNDPRSSSTHSLVPSESGRDGRRKLLLVFIHGFMGNETSFQSFPAHVHNLVTITLEETHIVHTKIYPRYKSRKPIEFARDDFSTWLQPHENDYTDVILLGHSMGGLLSAEVALKTPLSSATGKPFQHRILGTVSFDTPFLGMHPGVVVSGLGSLFRPAPDPPGTKPQSGTTTPSVDASTASSSYAPSTIISDDSSATTPNLSRISSNDPYFNPPFPNDIRSPERKGWFSLLHFVNKHSDDLTTATMQYFTSHLEFGGCMADYSGLKDRYQRIRALEDVDDSETNTGREYRPPIRRIRFINYYTASTGRPKKPKIPHGYMLDKDGLVVPIEAEMQDMSLEPSRSKSSNSPEISVDQHHDDGTVTPQPTQYPGTSAIQEQMGYLGENSGVHDDIQEAPELPEMRHIDSMPIEDDDLSEAVDADKAVEESEEPTAQLEPTETGPKLPPIPPVPTEPDPIDLTLYTDKDARKIAEKEHKRVMRSYHQAVKDRESAIRDRKKLVEKREKREKQEHEKKMKAEEKQRLRAAKEEEKLRATINPEQPRERQASVTSSSVRDDKPKRDKKFCMLPPEYGGKRDKCWVRVYMEGVDEVGAHCGLFFPGPQYESLVGDVGARIEKWVREDAERRAAAGGDSVR